MVHDYMPEAQTMLQKLKNPGPSSLSSPVPGANTPIPPAVPVNMAQVAPSPAPSPMAPPIATPEVSPTPQTAPDPFAAELNTPDPFSAELSAKTTTQHLDSILDLIRTAHERSVNPKSIEQIKADKPKMSDTGAFIEEQMQYPTGKKNFKESVVDFGTRTIPEITAGATAVAAANIVTEGAAEPFNKFIFSGGAALGGMASTMIRNKVIDLYDRFSSKIGDEIQDKPFGDKVDFFHNMIDSAGTFVSTYGGMLGGELLLKGITSVIGSNFAKNPVELRKLQEAQALREAHVNVLDAVGQKHIPGTEYGTLDEQGRPNTNPQTAKKYERLVALQRGAYGEQAAQEARSVLDDQQRAVTDLIDSKLNKVVPKQVIDEKTKMMRAQTGVEAAQAEEQRLNDMIKVARSNAKAAYGRTDTSRGVSLPSVDTEGLIGFLTKKLQGYKILDDSGKLIKANEPNGTFPGIRALYDEWNKLTSTLQKYGPEGAETLGEHTSRLQEMNQQTKAYATQPDEAAVPNREPYPVQMPNGQTKSIPIVRSPEGMTQTQENFPGYYEQGAQKMGGTPTRQIDFDELDNARIHLGNKIAELDKKNSVAGLGDLRAYQAEILKASNKALGTDVAKFNPEAGQALLDANAEYTKRINDARTLSQVAESKTETVAQHVFDPRFPLRTETYLEVMKNDPDSINTLRAEFIKQANTNNRSLSGLQNYFLQFDNAQLDQILGGAGSAKSLKSSLSTVNGIINARADGAFSSPEKAGNAVFKGMVQFARKVTPEVAKQVLNTVAEVTGPVDPKLAEVLKSLEYQTRIDQLQKLQGTRRGTLGTYVQENRQELVKGAGYTGGIGANVLGKSAINYFLNKNKGKPNE